YDDNDYFGTWKPLVELGAAPAAIDEATVLPWLLTKHVELAEARIDWLRFMPQRLKEAGSYAWLLQGQAEALADYNRIQREGFSGRPDPTLREILEFSRKR